MSVEVTTGDRRADVLDGDVTVDQMGRRIAVEESARLSPAARAAAAMLARSPGILPPSWWSQVLNPHQRDLAGASEANQKSTSEQPTTTSAAEETAWSAQGESKLLADKEPADRVCDAVAAATAALQQSGLTSADGSLFMTEYGLVFGFKQNGLSQ
jgi:hypothetical protein